jgi:cobalt-zinc-cadmium efflux system outer membrane protein
MRGRSLCLLLCASGLAPACIHAQGLTLRAAVDSALRNNLDLRVARSLSDSARSETRIARALPNPSYSVIPNTPMQYSGTIALDVGPQRIYRVRASDLGARAARSDVGDNTRLTVLAVERAYFDVLLADARRSVVTARRAIIRQVVAADSARVHAGDIPERSLIRSGVELVRADADVARAGVDAQTTRLALQGLMGVASPDTALHLDGALTYAPVAADSDIAMDAVLARRPDVAASRIREEQSAAAERLAASAIVPVPQLSYVRQYSAPFESGHYYALGIGVEVPILNQYGGQRERAAAGRAAAALLRRRTEAQASREVRSALAEFRTQEALVRQYESGVIAKVGQNVDATRYAYSRGAVSLLEVLDALRAQQDVMTDYYTALRDYWVAAHTLRAAQGVT